MIVKTVKDWIDLRREFIAYGRQSHFTEDGYEALYDLLSEREYMVELDVIAICCDFYEAPAAEVLEQYDDVETIEDLQDRTWAVALENGNILIQNF